MNSAKAYSVFFLFITGQAAYAEKLSLKEAWTQINSDSVAQEASRLQTELLNQSESRATRHWLPRVYLNARSYQTNDPGSSFIGLLEQRSVQQNDFIPDAINRPNAHTYTIGTLGVDLPLYEGGMKSAQVEALKKSAQAQDNMTSQIQLEQFSQVSLSYASIAIINQQRTKIIELSSQIDRLLKNYRLGSRSNPVGYSGLLGMKSLANRLSGLNSQYESQIKSYYLILIGMGLKRDNWSPAFDNTIDFVDRYMLAKSQNAGTASSYQVQALKENAQASEEAAHMEKAKFMPKLGAFAESSVFNGNRDTANSYTAGLYLQWNLFDPSTYGSLKEAHLKSSAMKKSSEAAEQQERAERSALHESVSATRANIKLLNDSYALLLEQSQITETLFKNGSLNALQLLEVLSRRTDLVVQQSEAEITLVKTASQFLTKENFDISKQLAGQ